MHRLSTTAATFFIKDVHLTFYTACCLDYLASMSGTAVALAPVGKAKDDHRRVIQACSGNRGPLDKTGFSFTGL
jgi:hypothetical protein